MRVSFDSNAWERIFLSEDQDYSAVRVALMDRILFGFICDASLGIEAVTKKTRSRYFARPLMDVQFKPVIRDEKPYWQFSIGPEDSVHPGLPKTQATKLHAALAAGIKLMRGQNWLGLPRAREVSSPDNYVFEDAAVAAKREQTQLDVAEKINARGVGRRAFEMAGGWKEATVDEKALIKACAEWADGELVAAHIAYGNDILCTNDRARGAGSSIFDAANRSWLASDFGVNFMTVDALLSAVSARRADEGNARNPPDASMQHNTITRSKELRRHNAELPDR